VARSIEICCTIVGEGWLGVSPTLSDRIRLVISIVILWPFAIGWRRYFQGLLIHGGHSNAVAQAGIIRLVSVQNAIQGFLVSEGRTWDINHAAWLGAVVMLVTAYLGIKLEQNGAFAAAIRMILASMM
jgi:hypothetical protein